MNILTGVQQRKYHNAILYFAQNCENGTVGKKKLAKLLYKLDFDHFEKHLIPVTRAEYIKKDHGPVPRDFWAQLAEMQKRDMIRIEIKPTPYERDMELIVPLIEPDLNCFNAEELETLERTKNKWYSSSGREMAIQSHQELPWDRILEEEHIPYQLALHRSEEAFFNDEQ